MKSISFSTLFVVLTLAANYACGQGFGLKDPLQFPPSDKLFIKALPCKNGKEQKLFGVAYIPKGKEGTKYPLVILAHGYSSSHMFMTDYGVKLAESGIACYSFDFSGGSNLSKSEGKTIEMSVKTEKDDLSCVLKASKDWAFVDTDNVFLSGESQGGFVTALCGVEHQADLKGMILLYPAFQIPEAMQAAYPNGKGLQNEMPFPNGMKIGRMYVEDVAGMDAYKDTKGFKKSVLIIHGDNDKAVPLSYSERAAREYPSATLKVINGAGHVFIMDTHRNEAIAAMIEYVKKASPPQPPK